MTTISKKELLTVDSYMASLPDEVRIILEQIREIIREAAPGAEEAISYGIPAFKLHGMLLWYAAFKDHYGLYPLAETITVFKEKLEPYKLRKGTIQFPYSKPIPVKLITEIVKYRVKKNIEKSKLKQTKKSSSAA